MNLTLLGFTPLHGLSTSVCPACRNIAYDIPDLIHAELERWSGTLPDAIGCGHYPLLAISSRVLDDWERSCGVGKLPVGTIELPGDEPAYYWVRGERTVGARIDEALSGRRTAARRCPTCGTVTNPEEEELLAISPSTWNGSHDFTTRFSPTVLFCTERVVRCAAKNKHTNFSFTSAEG